MSTFGEFAEKLVEYSWEDDREKSVCRAAEPLIARMGPGKNYYSRKQFKSLVRYMLHGGAAAKASKDGLFRIGEIEIIRSEHMTDSRALTVARLAKVTGVPRQNLELWLSQAEGIPVEVRGKRKLYDIDSLRAHLSKCQ
jgi:hypothetical protein